MDKIDEFIENCNLEDLQSVANSNCNVCCGMGWYLDDPSPPGLYLSAGDYTMVCDCLDIELIVDRF